MNTKLYLIFFAISMTLMLGWARNAAAEANACPPEPSDFAAYLAGRQPPVFYSFGLITLKCDVGASCTVEVPYLCKTQGTYVRNTGAKRSVHSLQNGSYLTAPADGWKITELPSPMLASMPAGEEWTYGAFDGNSRYYLTSHRAFSAGTSATGVLTRVGNQAYTYVDPFQNYQLIPEATIVLPTGELRITSANITGTGLDGVAVNYRLSSRNGGWCLTNLLTTQVSCESVGDASGGYGSWDVMGHGSRVIVNLNNRIVTEALYYPTTGIVNSTSPDSVQISYQSLIVNGTNGVKVTTTTRSGYPRIQLYDVMDRLVSDTDESGYVQTMEWTLANQLAKLTDNNPMNPYTQTFSYQNGVESNSTYTSDTVTASRVCNNIAANAIPSDCSETINGATVSRTTFDNLTTGGIPKHIRIENPGDAANAFVDITSSGVQTTIATLSNTITESTDANGRLASYKNNSNGGPSSVQENITVSSYNGVFPRVSNRSVVANGMTVAGDTTTAAVTATTTTVTTLDTFVGSTQVVSNTIEPGGVIATTGSFSNGMYSNKANTFSMSVVPGTFTQTVNSTSYQGNIPVVETVNCAGTLSSNYCDVSTRINGILHETDHKQVTPLRLN